MHTGKVELHEHFLKCIYKKHEIVYLGSWKQMHIYFLYLGSIRVSTLTMQTCLVWICATSTLRWPTWEEPTWLMPTWAGQTWREQTCPWPASTWALFSVITTSSEHTHTHAQHETSKLALHPSQAANLQGVKMLCTNAEGASLRGCNFEDPAGIKANLEGKADHNTFLYSDRSR